jgi:hypothetical protein
MVRHVEPITIACWRAPARGKTQSGKTGARGFSPPFGVPSFGFCA